MFDQSEVVRARIRTTLRLLGCMLILCLALQALVYRSGLYYRVADPKSNTGAVVNALLILEQHYQPGARTVLVMGDFRIV